MVRRWSHQGAVVSPRLPLPLLRPAPLRPFPITHHTRAIALPARTLPRALPGVPLATERAEGLRRGEWGRLS